MKIDRDSIKSIKPKDLAMAMAVMEAKRLYGNDDNIFAKEWLGRNWRTYSWQAIAVKRYLVERFG